MIYLFIDTNVLLHYRRLEEIDWLGFSHSDEAVLLLSPVIIRELERQKITHPQRKLRKRAQEVVLNLHSKLTGSSEIRKGVRVEFITSDPRIDFASYKLRPEINDDWLLATVLEWKLEHQEADIRIVSADLGMSIKAKSYGVSVLSPFEGDRLAEELDTDERRIIQLQRELTELRSSLPELRLVFMDGETVAQFRTFPDLPIDLSYLETELKQLRAKYPELPIAPELSGPAKQTHTPGGLQGLLRKFGGIAETGYPSEEILRYSSELESFYKKYEDYLRARHNYENTLRRTFSFAVILENCGSSPAEDIDVHLHFPDGFQLFSDEDENIPRAPEPPEPPAGIGTFGFTNRNIDAFHNLASIGLRPRNVGPPPNVSAPTIRRTSSYDARSHVRRVKHGYQVTLAQFVSIFDSFASAHSFQIDYSLLAANLPRPISGKLSVVVEKQT